MAIFQPNATPIRDLLGGLFERRSEFRTEIAKWSLDRLLDHLTKTVSEAQEAMVAREILLRYNSGSTADRFAFFDALLLDYDLDAEAVAQAARALSEHQDPKSYRALMRAAEPGRKTLFRQLAAVKGGTACLVKIREDLRRALKERPEYGRIDDDLKTLLQYWFNRGFLELRPISWESPAHILEKIIAYEAVHTIHDWDDLRRRLHPEDRRCYGFFHPRMPDDPLIFVEVALTSEVPNSVDTLLAEDRVPRPVIDMNTAVFYSISNCHAGLAGISFGNALIKTVARRLAQDLPQVKNYMTLSPVPGLRKWLETETPGDALPQLAAQYLVNAKDAKGRPLDPVARFHLGNGAQLAGVWPDANSSNEGIAQSFGVMVNYLYELDHVDARAEGFATQKTVSVGPKVAPLLPRGKRASAS